MSMLARRSLLRAIPRSRGYATDVTNASYHEKAAALKEHAAQSSELWRKVSFFACVPAIVAGGLWVYKVEQEHAHHEAHVREEHGGELPAVPDYEYLNRRVVPYPWGPNSLFYNKETNRDLSQ